MFSYTLRFCILARTLGAKYDILEDAFWEFRKKHIKWNQDAKTAVNLGVSLGEMKWGGVWCFFTQTQVDFSFPPLKSNGTQVFKYLYENKDPNVCCAVLSHFHHMQLFVIPWTIACQAPLSMGFSRQEYWSVLPLPGDLPDPETESVSLTFPALVDGFLKINVI